MPILDYREIPEAHKGSGLQDTFEQFEGEFLEFLGMHLLERPSRGADAGKDLIALEVRSGRLGKSSIRYLVSCKHKAFSGAGVSPTDEQDIADRIARERIAHEPFGTGRWEPGDPTAWTDGAPLRSLRPAQTTDATT